MFSKLKNLKQSQALIEIVISIALTMFFLGSFIVNISYITSRFVDFQQKNFAYELLKENKDISDRNLSYFLTNNKMLDGWKTLGYFPDQGSHLSYTYMNYGTDKAGFTIRNQEKKLFLSDDYLYYWSLDAIPTDTTYVIDDAGDKIRQGTVTCYGSSCTNPEIISPSLGKCVSNNCIKFSNSGSNGSAIAFPTISSLEGIKNISWESWVYPTSVATDQMFLSKQGANYFRINNSKPFASFNISGTQRTLAGATTLQNNTWYHLLTTYDGTNIKIYVNGNLDATSPSYIGDIVFTSGNMIFGAYDSSDVRGFIGYLDEIKIYNYALNAYEAQNHYKGFREQIGLLGLWHFDDALNTATFNGISETGLNPKFSSFSVPDNIKIDFTKTSAINDTVVCRSGSCAMFTRDYSSKGILNDTANNYPVLHTLDNITIESWVKITTPSSSYQGIVGKTTPGIYEAGITGTFMNFNLNINGTRYAESYNAMLIANNWYLLTYTFDGTDMKVYVNGVLKQTWNHPGSITDDGSHTNILVGYSGSSNEYFDGYLDEVRIYNRALSLDEINNRYEGAYTYYQYFKPTCNPSSNSRTLDSECLNCQPSNSTECESVKYHSAWEPLLAESINYVKYGKGVEPKKLKIEQTVPVVNSFYLQPAGANIWGGGEGEVNAYGCNEFVFGKEGMSSNYGTPENNACGLSSCTAYRKIFGSKVCSANNISFYYSNGCSACSGTPGELDAICTPCTGLAKFQLTTASNGTFISPTFNYAKRMALTSFSWAGTGTKIKMQFACKDSIIDEDGNQVSEASWTYLGPDSGNSTRCSASGYYEVLNGEEMNPATCWETDNQAMHNCQFFRFKILLEPSFNAVVNNMWFNFGQYPYSIIKNQ
jgi:hypothetical protein